MLARAVTWATIGAVLCVAQMLFVPFSSSVVVAGMDVTRAAYCLQGASFGAAVGFAIGLLSGLLDRRANGARARGTQQGRFLWDTGQGCVSQVQWRRWPSF